jgi:hypothetical protein
MVHTCVIPSLSHFHCALEFATQILAYMLDSLVRVSRRVAEDHFVNILGAGVANNPPRQPVLQSLVCAGKQPTKEKPFTPEARRSPQSARWYLL